MVLTMFPIMEIMSFAETSGDFSYTVLSEADKTCEITDYTGSATNLTIPAILKGYTVVSIGRITFAYSKTLNNITIPNSVTNIENEVFAYCTSLESVTIPNTVTDIGVYAFRGCTSLTSITVPNRLTRIEDGVFYDCSALTEVIIPNTVKSIGDYAFRGCNSLSSITIPNSTTQIGIASFASCDSMTGIYVQNGNSAYSSVDGVLFNKNQTELIQYPSGREGTYPIPDGVVTIAEAAFFDCDSITGVLIPDSVTGVGYEAFFSCSSLKNVTIGNGLTSIRADEFEWCSSLTSMVIPKSVTSIALSNYSDELVIYGYTGSYAETYAKTNGFNFIALDAEPDGTLYAEPPASAVVGKTVDIPVYVDCGTDLGALYFTVQYDKTKLKYVSCEENAFSNCSVNSNTPGELILVSVSDSSVPAGKICVLRFRVISSTADTTDLTFSVQEAWDGSFDGVLLTLSGSICTLQIAEPTYTVTFNANGGSGAPEAQIKTGNVPLTLSGAIPKRTGYTFLGWATSATATSAQYAAGGTYTNDADVILYAVWKANTYTVTYNANGGSGTMANSSHTYDTAKALTANGFTRTGYTFLGWSTSASATTATYSNKQSVKNLTATNGATITLYAVWQKNPVTVSSIAIQSKPTKTVYTVGEKFDASGLKIEVTMSDGTTKTVTNGFTVSSPDMTAAGTKTVTVTYQGKTTSFNITVNKPVSPTSAKYKISGAKAVAGATVDVYISIENNPGIISLRNKITYDTSVLELVKVEDLKLLSGYTTPSPIVDSPYILRWADSLATQNNMANGNFVKLTFKIKDDAKAGDYSISVSHIESRTANGEKVEFADCSAVITVVNYILGDVDGNGVVDDWDAIVLNRYLAGWKTEANLAASDMDGNGEIDDWDAIALERKLAGWNS